MGLSVKIRKSLPGFTLQAGFSIEKERLGLLGGSGSGKSMTLKCIAGVMRPDEGRIVLNGRVLFDSETGVDLPPQKRKVGYLFQHYALFPNMTVLQNIQCGMRTGKPKGNPEELLAKFYLSGLGDRYPRQLSGGQQQRTALARMLVSEPDLILMDEPFSALDTCLREEMEHMVSGLLQRFDGPALIVSHNRDEIYRLCSQIAIYQDGSSERIASREDIFSNPGTVAAAVLTGCRNVLPARMMEDGTLWVEGWGGRFRTGCEIQEGTDSVGVRAHYFHIAEQMGENVIPCHMEKIMDGPFEQIAYLRPVGGSERLCWKAEKSALESIKDRKIVHLFISPDAVMPLRSRNRI